MSETILGDIRDEFAGAELPDWRLRERLMTLAEAVDKAPEASLPKVLRTVAAREAAYRFLGNPRVHGHEILAPHIEATVRRCQEAGGPVYVVSDTSEFSFAGPERGKKLGRLQGKSRGFLGHAALAVSRGGVPLGVLGIMTLVRSDEKKHRNGNQRKKDPDRESLRWGQMVATTSERLEDSSVQAIHVMDSEADIYELLTELQSCGRRFIVRAGQDRLVAQRIHLKDAVQGGQTLLEREIVLSRRTNSTGANSRRNAPRAGRSAQLQVSAMRLDLQRPKTCTVAYPAQLALNIVVVRETNHPEGAQPVEWVLFTSEPVANAQDVATVVDGYRRRWLIEEYFKAIKTGCSYEDRELESLRTLTNMLAIVAVIAWRLLRLRALERDDCLAPAAQTVDPMLLQALAARLRDIREPKALPPNPTVADFLAGIARLGGHITSNGRPGWIVLWRGYQDLLIWGGGFISRVQSNTC